MKLKRQVVFVCAIILLWWLLFMYIDNELMLPNPFAVFKQMIQHVTSLLFYQSVMTTLLRMISGFLCALFIAITCGYVSMLYPLFYRLLSPLNFFAKSVPNIAYILIILVWFGNELATSIIIFLIIYPILFENFYQAFAHFDPTLKDIMKLYPKSPLHELWYIYLPNIKAVCIASITSAASLGIKVGVMSEILGSIQVGIGRQLQIARLQIDMTEIFAYSIWLMIILLILEFAIKRYIK